MNRIVWKLARDEIRVYRKKTRLEIFVIALIAALVFLVNILLPPLKELYRTWCIEHYGTWYAYIEVPDDIYELCTYELNRGSIDQGRKRLNENPDTSESNLLHYGYLWLQGSWNDMKIGHASESLYELCNLQLIEGVLPASDEIAVSEQFSLEYQKSIGDTITLRIGEETEEYRICGIIRKPQDLFPDIYTAANGGHVLYFFDRMFGYNDAESHTVEISSYGLRLAYKENKYGYDHYTSANDPYRWQKEHTSFNDYSLLQTLTAFSAAVFLFLVQTAGEKKRAKEYTVLRASGMTSPQLICMAMLSTAAAAAAGIVCGLVLSFLISVISATSVSSLLAADASSLWKAYLNQPLKIIGLGFMILIFSLLGAWIPVLRSSQNAFTGSFEEVYQGKNKKHRTKLKFLNMRRLAAIRTGTSKGSFILMGILAAVICLLSLPENKNKALETSGAYRGSVPVVFESMHYISLQDNVPLNPSLYSDLPLTSRLFTCAYGIDEASIRTSDHDQPQTIGLSGGFVSLDENTVKDLNYTGSLPQNEHEIMIFSSGISIYERTDEGSVTVSDSEVKPGDTIWLKEEPYTVSGLILPNETKIIRFPTPDGEMIMNGELYSIPQCAAAVLPETIESLGLEVTLTERLLFENHEDLYPILNRMTACGFKPGNDVTVSDFTISYDSYDSRFVSIRLSWGMTVIVLIIGMIVSALLKALDERSDRRELISLFSCGITKTQLVSIGLWQAVFSSVFAILCVLCYGILRLLTNEPINLNPSLILIDLLMALIVFSVVYASPSALSNDLNFEKITEV